MSNRLVSLDNNEQSLKKFFNPFPRNEMKIVMEATGRYHRVAHSTLDALGFSVMVINPFQSRHFAQSMNIFCKTDKVDAKVLSQFAQRMDFLPTQVPSQKEAELLELVRYLDDLKGFLFQYQNRLEYAEGLPLKSLKHLIKSTQKEINSTEQAIEKLIQSDKQLTKRCEILTSIPGIGITTAASLMALVRELGSISNKKVAALAGLAPMNCDSGISSGNRHIQKGRSDVRRFLFIPILGAATQHNASLKEFYNRLTAAGKPKKVALIACMRKMIIFANALLKKGEMWNPNYRCSIV